MRCRIEVLPGDAPSDGESEFIEPCDEHADLAPTGVFHRMEMWKHLTPSQFVEVGQCVSESMRRISPDTPRVTRHFDVDGSVTI